MAELQGSQLREAAQTLSSAEGLRVALFTGNYNCTRDGANRALNRLVAHLLAEGAAVRVYSPTTLKPAFSPEGDLVSVPSLPLPGRSEYRVALGLLRSIRRDLEQFRPNLIHVSAPDFLGAGAQSFARERGIPIVASMHTRFETYLDYYGVGFLRDWAWRRQAAFYGRSDRVLAPNEECRQHVIGMGVAPSSVGIWRRGVDDAMFSPSRRDMHWRRSLGYSDDEMIVLFFGRLVREKGIQRFADTVAALRLRGCPIRPLVIGDGPAAGEMKRALGDAVFAGHLDGEDLGRAVASADILLNPSTTEAFGNVNLEAMAAGLTVVSADVESGRALIVHGVDGFLERPDPTAFANRLAMLLSEPLLGSRIRRNARTSACGRGWSDACNDVVRCYQRLLQTSVPTGPSRFGEAGSLQPVAAPTAAAGSDKARRERR